MKQLRVLIVGGIATLALSLILCGCCEELDLTGGTLPTTFAIHLNDSGFNTVAGLQFKLSSETTGGLDSASVEPLAPNRQYSTVHYYYNAATSEWEFILLVKRELLCVGDVLEFKALGAWSPEVELVAACDTLGQPVDTGDLTLTVVKD